MRRIILTLCSVAVLVMVVACGTGPDGGPAESSKSVPQLDDPTVDPAEHARLDGNPFAPGELIELKAYATDGNVIVFPSDQRIGDWIALRYGPNPERAVDLERAIGTVRVRAGTRARVETSNAVSTVVTFVGNGEPQIDGKRGVVFSSCTPRDAKLKAKAPQPAPARK